MCPVTWEQPGFVVVVAVAAADVVASLRLRLLLYEDVTFMEYAYCV